MKDNKIITTGAKLIITDFNHLPENPKDFWMNEYTDNYIVYDKAHRFNETNKIIHKENLGSNIHEIFEFIYSHYDKLPEIMIFCKGNVFPRHCSEEKFKKIINNTELTPIQNYIRNTPKYSPNIYAYVDDNDLYYEKPIEVNTTVNRIHKSKYIFSYSQLLDEIFEDSYVGEYICFAPGANYIITKNDALKFNKNFYKTMLGFISWTTIPGESYLFERALFTIYGSDFIIKNKYKNNNNE